MRIVFTGMPLWAALVPLAAYLITVGVVHLRRRPVTVSGQVDALLLAAAVSGFVMVGPLALLQPAQQSCRVPHLPALQALRLCHQHRHLPLLVG